MFDNLVKDPSTFLPCTAFLSQIFRKFKIDLASETNAVKTFNLFDRYVLLHMKLLETPPPRPTFLSQSSQRASQSTSTHFDDAYYNTLTAEVLDIKTKQTSMIESQPSILNNQSLILDQFMDMNIRMDHMDETLQEIL